MGVAKQINFPLFKLGEYEEIEETLMGKVYIYTTRGKYLLDNKALPYSKYSQRRLRLKGTKKVPLYKFRATVHNLRNLVKFPSGTRFIDVQGNLFKYKKQRKLYKVLSHKILKKKPTNDGSCIVHIEKFNSPYLIDSNFVASNTNYISIIYTKDGPLIYDYTTERHEPYRRSI